MKDVYTGEAQFMAWGDGPSGPWIKLRLPDSDDLTTFRGMTKAKDGMSGQILAIKIVEIEYVEPPKEAAHRKQGPLETLAIRWCKTQSFLDWLSETTNRKIDEAEARSTILTTCMVEHRYELDQVPAAAGRFHQKFRTPYMEYLEGRE